MERIEIRDEKGELHNLDGPAIINGNYKYWYINGKKHREDGPAIIRKDLEDNTLKLEWWLNGKKHRDDPSDSFALSGENYKPASIFKDFDEKIEKLEWYKNGLIHRENDEPAYIFKRNNIFERLEWYKNGFRHRENDFAFIDNIKKLKIWYKKGARHREDGPAYIDEIDGFYGWFINDIGRDDEWVEKYLKIKNNHTLLGVIVSDKWKIREIILRWRYDPKFKCVKNRLKKEYNNLFNLI
jgi:hypothetical protein